MGHSMEALEAGLLASLIVAIAVRVHAAWFSLPLSAAQGVQGGEPAGCLPISSDPIARTLMQLFGSCRLGHPLGTGPVPGFIGSRALYWSVSAWKPNSLNIEVMRPTAPQEVLWAPPPSRCG